MAYNAHHRVDPNQSEIMRFLREECGFSVQSLADLGKGVVDLMIGVQVINNHRLPEKIVRLNILLEVKKSERDSLNEKQEEWHGKWKGQCGVAFSPLSALEEINRYVSYVGFSLPANVKAKLLELRQTS